MHCPWRVRQVLLTARIYRSYSAINYIRKIHPNLAINPPPYPTPPTQPVAILRACIPEFERESVHLVGGHGQGLADGGVVTGLQVAPDLVALGSDGQQTVLVLNIPNLRNGNTIKFTFLLENYYILVWFNDK